MKINNKEINDNVKKSINELKNKKTFYKQIPNLLTCTRALAPLIIIPLVLTSNIIPAIVCAGIIASTDFFDGLIARKMKITSELGRELDGVCDKIFALGFSIPLVLLNPAYILNIILEGIIGITNLKARLDGSKPKTIFIGKIKTFFLSFNILLGYLMMINGFKPIIFASIFASTTIIQSITCSKYILLNSKKNENIKSNDNENTQNIKNIILKEDKVLEKSNILINSIDLENVESKDKVLTKKKLN